VLLAFGKLGARGLDVHVESMEGHDKIDDAKRLNKSTVDEVLTMDYRCEDGCFPVSASCVTISNPNLYNSSETGVILGSEP
jgi:hypothetical protein